jgi:hypothetical protein
MRILGLVSAGLLGFVLAATSADAAATASGCNGIKLKGDKPMQAVTLPPSGACKASMKNGYPIPDPSCTPGAVNPSLTLAVLTRKGFGTKCMRDKASTPSAKAKTYDWYDIEHPANNRGANQVCELDHLISLEIGGADTLDNLWPQCGPDAVTLNERFFKQKDLVENYLAAQVRAKKMKLADAQTGIASDWTQYLDDAKAYYKHHKARNDGG